MDAISIIAITAINVILIFLLTVAPLGKWTIQVSRSVRAPRKNLWEAVWPLGMRAGWEGTIIKAEPCGDRSALLTLAWPGRDGFPIRRQVELADVKPGEKFTLKVSDDTSLEQNFWKDFRQTTELAEKSDGTVTVTWSASDNYRGLAFLVFRYFSMRRTARRLKQWAETGVLNKVGIYEHPLSQFGFACLSALLIWPLFGFNTVGFLMAVTLTLVVALHELGHIAAFLLMGHKTARMIFIPVLGGIAIGGRPYDTRYEIAFVALMGAGLSALWIFPAIGASHIADSTGYSQLGAGLALFAGFCAIFNIANLVPVWKFDGGQILRQLFQRNAQLVLASFILSGLFFLVGFHAGVSLNAMVAGAAVCAILSLLTSGSAIKPRHAMKPMTRGQYTGIITGFAAVFAIHSAGLLWAVDRFFS